MKFSQTQIYIMFFATAFLFGCASKPVGEAFAMQKSAVDTDKARVFIYKNEQLYGSAFSWLITEGENKLAIMSNNTYFVFDSSPKTLTLKADLRSTPTYIPTSPLGVVMDTIGATNAHETNSKIQLEDLHTFSASAGATYYFRLEFKHDVVSSPQPYLVAVDEEDALKEMQGTRFALL
ncbi:hypothetical protein [Paraglaciecola chathamensis]|uniref:hypothetical protein n=1 Tax=Paraglaciecola chathamensis TaxID=368405 RepID=UPI00271033ED|nr:hypothetical protein [Paraglaciecola chathamensis]MDO6561164.1 hypothetical protein [Paraglaciecola chathamensis]